MTQTRYKNAKIYKIVNDIDDYIYVGSTCSPLYKRKYHHKNDSKSPHKQHRIIYKHLRDINQTIDDCKIILIEEYPCKNKQELLKRERYWYDKLYPKLCFARPYVTREEKSAHNRLCKKKYKEKNKEKRD